MRQNKEAENETETDKGDEREDNSQEKKQTGV